MRKYIPTKTLEIEKVLQKSFELNEHFRTYGQLGDAEKPFVVSAILLALREKKFKISNLTGDDVKTDGQKIFDAVSIHIEIQHEIEKDVILGQLAIVKDRTILNEIDQRLTKTPLRFFTEYLQKNVHSLVVENLPIDVLGYFYGEFIRFSGRDGQTLGVVLTPKHITELSCDLVNLTPTDKVLDPCCGTGGYLISAMYKMLNISTEKEKVEVKSEKIHGIELREDMFSIASINMILRSAGKNNLIKHDFLKIAVEKLRQKKYTVGLMNPPYSQAKGKETFHLSEFHFIKHLLDSLADGGRCIVIIPQSIMLGKTKNDKEKKKEILERHTLEGVITLNKKTFYGIGTNACIAIFTAHKPHDKEKYCKVINFEDDGYKIQKHVGLVETERAKEKKVHLLNVWFNDAPTESKFMVRAKIEYEDEWLHSYFYFNDEIPINKEFEEILNKYLSFEFQMVLQNKRHLFNEAEKFDEKIIIKSDILPLSEKKWGEFLLSEIFQEIQRGKRLIKENQILGNSPYVSSTAMNNGIDEFIANEEKVRIFSNCLTIANSGSVGACFYHPYTFVASDHVTKLKNKKLTKYVLLFLSVIISRLGEKYSFNREINDKRIKREKIILPINKDESLDIEYMERYMILLEFNLLKKHLNYLQNKKVVIERVVV